MELPPTLLEAAFYLNLAIFLLTVLNQCYFFFYKLALCRPNQYRAQWDPPAIVILTFYNFGIALKLASQIIWRFTQRSSKWVTLLIYVAIIVEWAMLYVFVFEMKIVQVKIQSQSS